MVFTNQNIYEIYFNFIIKFIYIQEKKEIFIK